MQSNRTSPKKKDSGKSRESTIPDEYLAEVLKKVDALSQKEKQKQMLVAGKELVLLLLFFVSFDIKVENDIPASVAFFLKGYPEALKEALVFYERIKQAPAVTLKLMQGFNPVVYGGKLQIHFNWKTTDLGQLEELAKESAGQGEKAGAGLA